MDNFCLSDLIDLTAVQKMANAHYKAASMPIGIIDAFDGSVLVGVGWQDICVKFHRANQDSRKRCQASDNYIKDHLTEGHPCHYKCQNGLWDIGIPIVVAGRHLATMFLGQFFYEDETPEREFFVRQAHTFGFDLNDYLAALDRVPVFAREKVKYILEYNNALANFLIDLAEHSLSKITAEKVLVESELKYRRFVETANEGVWAIDANRCTTFVNQRMTDILGYAPEEMLGKSVESFMFSEDLPDHLARMKQREQGHGGAYERRFRNKDGDEVWTQMSATAIMGEDGHFYSSHALLTDITDRKRVEEGLRKSEEKFRKLNETLEQRVAKRTAELKNRTLQLQQLALELSDAEDRERRRIASILHDDFQQELAYIKMELGILKKDTTKKVRQRLGFLEQLIGGSIGKSRDLSYEINPPALHRSGLLPALGVLAQDMKDKFGLSVKLLTHPGAEPDSLALASILYRLARELLLNVLKHAGVDSAVMDIRCKNGMIYISVEDFGKGFDYDTVRSSQGRGVGFGLYSIEDRVTFLGGSMKIKTAPGRGCCVMLTVPKAVSRKTAIPAPPCEDTVNQELMGIAPADPAQPLNDRRPIRILLADDHQLMREALANLLKNCKGMTIVGQANDGREAIQLAAQIKPHVILMDVTMPVLDGFDATARITRDHPDIRIIGLSMHNDAHTRQKMLHAGASAYLTKTGSPDTLVETIRKVHHDHK